MHRMKPIVGQWYMRHDKGQIFSVAAIDAASGTVETQDYDGNLDETDIKSWFALDIEPIATPEDWTAPIDTVEADDVGATETGMSDAEWLEPLQSVHKDEHEAWESTALEEEGDEWDEGVPEEPFIDDEPETARRSTK